MIAFLSGTVLVKKADSLILNCNSVGYRVLLPLRLLDELRLGQILEVYTYHHIREDNQELFGFLDQLELDLFKQLITVQGIGPKKALSVLNSAGAADISTAIASGDPARLAQTSGISLKISERIILDLKNKVMPISGSSVSDNWRQQQEVIEALVSLGYSSVQAQGALKSVVGSFSDSQSLLKEALKILGKGIHN